jgi:DNA-binding beta-propeller fold protein YncE
MLAPNGSGVPVVRFETGRPGRIIATLRARRAYPLGVAAEAGTTYVSTFDGDKVFVYHAGELRPHGSLCSAFCTGFDNGAGITVGPDGGIYVAVEANGSSSFAGVIEYLPGKKRAKVFNVGGILYYAAGIAVDKQTNLVLADPVFGRIDIISGSGAVRMIETGGQPQSVALDSSQTHLYVTNLGDLTASVYTYPAGIPVAQGTVPLSGATWAPASMYAL